MSLLKYRPDIDGLRAVAVLGVVLYHAGLGFPGGYVGVDVFFVISGYLITSLIVKELHAGDFSMVNFWARRARRILPALSVMVAAVLLAGWFWMLPADYETLAKQTVALAFFCSNIKFWMESGYFDTIADEKPLLHTWSLSLEEQFYLIIPVLLGLLFRWGKRGWIIPVLVAGTAASFLVSIHWTQHFREAAFFLLPARAWELGAGSLLAFCGPISQPWLRSTVSWLGMLAILAPFFFYTSQTAFPGWAALPPVAGAALLIWAGKQNGSSGSVPAPNKFLSTGPFISVGLISYSLYLWHWPLFAFAKYGSTEPLGNAEIFALVAASFALAILSYRFVEQPFRNRRFVRNNKQVFVWSGATVALLLIAAGGVWATRGYPQRLPADAVRLAKGKDDWSTQFGGYTRAEDIPDNLVQFGRAGGPPEVFLWGDSHAMAVLPALDAACKRLGISGRVAKTTSTAPVVGWTAEQFRQGEETLAYNGAVARAIENFAKTGSLKTVVLAARWSGYATADDMAFRESLRNTVIDITGHGCRVILLHEVPNFPFEPPKTLALAAAKGQPLDRFSISVADYRQQSGGFLRNYTDMFNNQPKVEILNPEPYFADDQGMIKPYDQGGVLFRDGNHLTVHGSMKLAEPFREALAGTIAQQKSPTDNQAGPATP